MPPVVRTHSSKLNHSSAIRSHTNGYSSNDAGEALANPCGHTSQF